MDEIIHQSALIYWKYLYKDWLTTELLSARWFYLITLTTIGYIVWFQVLDKARLKELLLLGSFVAVSITAVGIAGTTMQLWQYKLRILPFMMPPIFMGNYTLLPISTMIVHQFTNTWSEYLLWSAVVAGIFSFIFNPFQAWLGIIEFHKWHPLPNFIIIYAIANIARGILIWVSGIENKQIEVNKKISSLPNYQPAFKRFEKEK